MGNVIGLPPVVVHPESENPARRQIQLRSRIFAILFTAALALAIAFTCSSAARSCFMTALFSLSGRAAFGLRQPPATR